MTFGGLRPLILVPTALASVPAAQQFAMVTHELHHVARRDWLVVIAEECVRAAAWFHPAVWFAIAEVQLAREEVVDRCTVASTGSRQDYLEALVTVAAGSRAMSPHPRPRCSFVVVNS